MVTLNKRQIKLIEFLEKESEWITIENIAKAFGVSVRTIRNDLDSISRVLSKYNIKLEKKTKVGVRLILKRDQSISYVINGYENKIYSYKERALMISMILLIKESSTIEELASYIRVSKNTLVNDLKFAEEKLKEFDVDVIKKSYKGITVNDSFKKLADTFLSIYIDLEEGQEKEVYRLIYKYSNVTRNDIRKIIEKIEEKNNVQYIEESLEELEKALLFALCKANNIEILNGNNSEKSEISILKEAIEDIVNIKLSYEILEYLSTIFKGAKKSKYIDHIDKRENIKKITTEIVRELCQIINIDINSEVELIKQMEMHLDLAIYRLRNNLIIENPMLEEIKYKMSFLYDITEKILKNKRDIIGFEFPESEVAYITMYFGTLFEKHVKYNLNANVLIVCNGGFATSSLLKSRISLMLPELKIKSICTMRDIDKNLENSDIDFIISTVPLNMESYKVIKVNPLLDSSDCERIKAEVYNKWYKRNCQYLIDKVKEESIGGIARIIPEKYTSFNIDIEDWRKAIEIASEPLVKDNKIKKAYINDMVRAIETLGNYMVFIPEIAFVHAPPENVLESSVSYLNLKSKIDFGSKSKVDVKTIVVLADKEESKNLIDIVNILTKDRNMEKFKNATKYAELKELV